ncbi:hypothetical protein CEJ86_33710, partial [Sinorhizobium meliloti]
HRMVPTHHLIPRCQQPRASKEPSGAAVLAGGLHRGLRDAPAPRDEGRSDRFDQHEDRPLNGRFVAAWKGPANGSESSR